MSPTENPKSEMKKNFFNPNQRGLAKSVKGLRSSLAQSDDKLQPCRAWSKSGWHGTEGIKEQQDNFMFTSISSTKIQKASKTTNTATKHIYHQQTFGGFCVLSAY